jgi:hypothetical protein
VIVAQIAYTVTVGFPLVSRTLTCHPSLFAVGSDRQNCTLWLDELYPPPRTVFPEEQVTVIGLLFPPTVTEVDRLS